MKNKITGIIISSLLLNLLVFQFSTAATDAFKDIAGHWAKASILQAVQTGYVTGYPDGTFRPDNNVSRAEFIKLIVVSLKLSVTNDTYAKNWYDPYVKAANAAGIYASGDFKTGNMNTSMDRYEMSRAASRAINQKNAEDKEWMYLATKNGLILGMDNTGTLGQNLNTTRAQSITVIQRILTVNADGTLKVDKHAVNRAEVLWHGTNAFSMMEYSIGKDDPRWEQIQASLKTFNPTNLSIETPTGVKKVKKVIDALLFIDLDDPQDPNRNLIPSGAKVFPFSSDAGPFYLKNYKNAFVILTQGRELVNEDKINYAANDKFFTAVNSGVNIDIDRLRKGDISNQGAVPIFVDHIGENLDAKILSKDFKYFPTVESVIISKPPAPTYQKNIFKLALINSTFAESK